ncbi:MAG: hypothetical protein H0W84_11930 [Bacteroidetes bacterium]|nr:hypothetical protein [Bacteroidota bacterium]
MLQLDFTKNWNGKLFLDHFSDIRLHSQAFAVGVEMEVMVKSISFGLVKIEAVRQFPFSRLSDVVAYANIGKPAYYQADLLNRFYGGGQPLRPDQMLTHLVCAYIQRNILNQASLLEEWWKEKSNNA